jgi:hypothetical protein
MNSARQFNAMLLMCARMMWVAGQTRIWRRRWSDLGEGLSTTHAKTSSDTRGSTWRTEEQDTLTKARGKWTDQCKLRKGWGRASPEETTGAGRYLGPKRFCNNGESPVFAVLANMIILYLPFQQKKKIHDLHDAPKIYAPKMPNNLLENHICPRHKHLL